MKPKPLGRYLLFEAFARGGMANVHYGRVTGPVGFSRIVAIKRHHEHLARETEFVSMLIDEARIAGRIRHPNVVPVLDVAQLPGELLLVMDYVAGIALSQALKLSLERGELPPLRVAAAVVAGALEGLNAAHETRDDKGALAGIVHRDVSPQNVLCGADGLVRVTDFGIAHARERLQTTRTEEIKGKLEYMAKEQLRHERVDRRTDVYAASVILWELLTGARMFAKDSEQSLVRRVTAGDFVPPSSIVSDIPPELDEIVMRGLSPEPVQRFASALEMASALERSVGLATQREVVNWMESIAGDLLARRARRVSEIEAWTESVARDPSAETIVEALDDGVGEASEPERSAPASVLTRPTPGQGVTESRTLTSVTDDLPTEAVAAVRALAGPARAPESRPLGRLLWALPVGAALLGCVLVAAVLASRTGPEPIRQDTAPATTALASALPTPLEALPAPPPAPAASSGPAPASAAAPPSSARKPGLATVRPTKRPPPSCSPPYSVDVQGVRVPKPECFGK